MVLWSVVVWLLVSALGVLGVCSCDIFDVGDMLRGMEESEGKRHEMMRGEGQKRVAWCFM